MMKLKVLIYSLVIISIIAFDDSCFGQVNTFKRNSFYFELLGKGRIYSLNIDHIFYLRNKIKLTYRGGIGFDMPSRSQGILSLPIGLNLLLGSKTHHIEIGYGLTYLHYYDRHYFETYYYYDSNANYQHINYDGGSYLLLVNNMSLGYRYQPKDGGIFFSTYAMCWFSPVKLYQTYFYKPRYAFNTDAFTPYLGISVGYCF